MLTDITWRKQREEGALKALSKARGRPKPDPRDGQIERQRLDEQLAGRAWSPSELQIVDDVAQGDEEMGAVAQRDDAVRVDPDMNGNQIGSRADIDAAQHDEEGVVDVPAGTYDVEIAPTGAGVSGSAFSAPGVGLPEGTAVIVYATGDLAAGSFGLVVQTISGLGAAPAAVPTGSATSPL